MLNLGTSKRGNLLYDHHADAKDAESNQVIKMLSNTQIHKLLFWKKAISWNIDACSLFDIVGLNIKVGIVDIYIVGTWKMSRDCLSRH